MEMVPEAAAERRGLLDKLDAVLVGGFALMALGLSALNVILRTFWPSLTVEWGDEVQIYLVIWAVCISFAAVTAANRHIKADLFVDMMPDTMRRMIALFGDILGLVVSLVLGYFAYLVTYETWDFGDVSTTTLRFPLWIYSAALPVGMAFMAVRYAFRVAAGLGIGGKSA